MKLGFNIGLCAALSCLLLVSGCQTLGSLQLDQAPLEPTLTAANADTNSASDTTSDTISIILDTELSVNANPSSDTLEEQQAAMHQMAIDLAKAEENRLAKILALKEVALEQAELKKQNDAWYRLRQGMQLEPVDNKRVQAQLKWFLEHRAYLTRVMERAAPILPFVLNELEKQNLPSELALLPIVESAYQAFAYSPGRASGLWQIIPATGRHLGLKQNWWYDGRRDIIESTRAAIRYLVSLSGQFDGDWELALASYNAGPGRIRSAIRHNKKMNRPTDFWHLTKIHRETTNYVPKFMALKELFGNPEKYNLELFPVDNKHSYAVVELDGQLDLALAADLAGITLNQLYQLNPAFNRWATAPKGPHRLLLPLDKADSFKIALQAVPPEKRINWIRHKIKPGESLGSISRRYQTTISLIKSINEIKGTQIRAGKYLMVPTATKSLKAYTMTKNARLEKIQNKNRSGTKKAHIVRSGQSLWTISRNYGVTTAALAKWNGIAPIDTLRVGQKLIVWTKRTSEVQQISLSSTGPTKAVHALRYTIRKGDSLSRIASRFNIRISDIKRWNKIGKYIQPGQKLKLYVDITQQSG
jgi:membrane-bound lytic murein transglycosylase D|tara:strand:- start:4634 stop:6397 length:1764 start_codon:yes stop_codon:yes gene_type:complete